MKQNGLCAVPYHATGDVKSSFYFILLFFVVSVTAEYIYSKH